MRVLVCGGAGYIGSHMLPALDAAGHEAVVFDDLSTGHRDAVGDAPLVEGDLLRPGDLDAAFAGGRFDAVMHFAARSLVAESVREPLAYYEHNVAGTLRLLQAMRRAGVERLVFSSTAAVYGEPRSDRIDEAHPVAPINPYGAGKAMVERMLADAAGAYGLRSVSLRYFNAAGAAPGGRIGESHDPETHLIPNVLRAMRGEGGALTVHGADYPTRDGTCVRDYVHVDDLAAAHLAALDYMDSAPGAHAFNLGNGDGFSVLEVIEAARAVVGHEVPYTVGARRPGDPAVLVASSALARERLGWRPAHTDIGEIIATAWAWHRDPRY